MDSLYDVAVVGAGSFGAWTAFELRRQGASVILLDAYGPANSRASSGGESRIIRLGYGKDEIYTRWAAKALPRWQEFFERADDPLFHKIGVLWLAGDDDPLNQATLETLEGLRVPHERLSRPDLERRYPPLAFPGVTWAILEPESGVLMARRAVQAVVKEAVRRGVEYRRATVRAPAGKGKLDSIRTASGERIDAGSFVFACGPWLPRVFPDVLGDRIFPTRQEVFFFGVPAGESRFAPDAMPAWISLADETYGMPDLEGRGVKIAIDRHGPAFDPETGDRVASAEGLRSVRDYVTKRFPALRNAPVVETRVCQYENSSNGDFLIDRHPNFENVWLVGGGSGHGFKHGPVVGEYVAARIQGLAQGEPRFALATKGRTKQRAVF